MGTDIEKISFPTGMVPILFSCCRFACVSIAKTFLSVGLECEIVYSLAVL